MSSTLHPLAINAMQACIAMNESKKLHFAWLEKLNDKREQGMQVTIAENQKLQQLLSCHDENVTTFRNEMQAVKMKDLQAYNSLIEHMQLLAEKSLHS